ncbi:MAG: PhzF family phenazine biosynthesis protein, partial [Anaerolineae bacterium]
MDFNFYTTDVFTDQLFGGNPLAVFPEAAGLNDEQMQLIAREFNISETIFVFPPEDAAHTARVRIFTPARELDFAGHPTVGCAFMLATLGQVELTGAITEIVLEENVGPVPVKIFTDAAGNVTKTELSAAKMPESLEGAPSADILAQVLSLEPEDILEGSLSPEVVTAGVPFLFVPVKNREALGRSAVNLAQWREHLEDTVARDMFIFCFDPELEGSNVRARMYAPSMGIAEDPATGAAATAFAGYLAKRA